MVDGRGRDKIGHIIAHHCETLSISSRRYIDLPIAFHEETPQLETARDSVVVTISLAAA